MTIEKKETQSCLKLILWMKENTIQLIDTVLLVSGKVLNGRLTNYTVKIELAAAHIFKNLSLEAIFCQTLAETRLNDE